MLLLSPPAPIRPDVKDFFSAGSDDKLIAFPRGVGSVLGAGELLTPILRAPRTAYSYNPKEQSEGVAEDLFAAGQQLALVSALQARNSARLTLVGSAEMFQDKWFDAEVSKSAVGSKSSVKTFNREFAKRVSGWTFQEIGVLRVNWIEHHLNEETGAAANESNPEIYRVKNDVVCYTTTTPNDLHGKMILTQHPACHRPTQSPSPSTPGPSGKASSCPRPRTPSSSSSACSRPSIGSP